MEKEFKKTEKKSIYVVLSYYAAMKCHLHIKKEKKDLVLLFLSKIAYYGLTISMITEGEIWFTFRVIGVSKETSILIFDELSDKELQI